MKKLFVLGLFLLSNISASEPLINEENLLKLTEINSNIEIILEKVEASCPFKTVIEKNNLKQVIKEDLFKNPDVVNQILQNPHTINFVDALSKELAEVSPTGRFSLENLLAKKISEQHNAGAYLIALKIVEKIQAWSTQERPIQI